MMKFLRIENTIGQVWTLTPNHHNVDVAKIQYKMIKMNDLETQSNFE